MTASAPQGVHDPDPRVLLAAERTHLAWIRTGVALMGFGFVVARFGLFLRELAAASGQALPARSNAAPIGVAIVAAGVLLNFWASFRHRGLVLRIERGEALHGHESGPLAIGITTAIGGVVLVLVLMGVLAR